MEIMNHTVPYECAECGDHLEQNPHYIHGLSKLEVVCPNCCVRLHLNSAMQSLNKAKSIEHPKEIKEGPLSGRLVDLT